MSRKIRERRERLWAKANGICYWCNIKTVMPKRGVHNSTPTNDLATVDHLRSRLNTSRHEPNVTNEERTVLSCWQCNNIRGILDQKTGQLTLRYNPTTKKGKEV